MSCAISSTPSTVPTNSLTAPFLNGYLRFLELSWHSIQITIKTIFNTFHPVCIGLQDAFLKSTVPLKLRGCNCVWKDSDTGVTSSGGVCILTSYLYPSTPLILHTNLQAVAVQVHARSLITVCSIYLPPHVINQQELSNLVDQFPTPTTSILQGDFNGHRILWGSDSKNCHGQQIE
ncbi:hypothetical protein AVEN_39039-1 [Araneus ventricosus]|uniref:Endonuclease/exonuclease/phosphatase domain-containing protein n=1 Tax=Araneus ventricosus TaxID=182803 RepID=A0A4Y2MBG0_ARAVE|nr:hypothetical protein AVEN_39039-1 [Araneus ventricosus]